MNKCEFKNLIVGEHIRFGRYPQSIVTDDDIIEALKNICGKPNIRSGSLWKDYNYVRGSGMYADVEYLDKFYRVVYRKKHREGNFEYEFSDYPDESIYVFLYESIEWRVLKIIDNRAMLVSEKLIDAQEYSIKKDQKTEYYKNNYEHSNVRAWLNSIFLETAFGETEMSAIETVTVCNAAHTTKKANNPYACNDTVDKVFLLSFEEAQMLFADNKDRWKKLTAYAKSQGLSGYKTHDAKYSNDGWVLRSPCHTHENFIRCVGYGGGLGDGGFSTSKSSYCALEAIAPALYIKIQ